MNLGLALEDVKNILLIGVLAVIIGTNGRVILIVYLFVVLAALMKVSRPPLMSRDRIRSAEQLTQTL